MLGTFYAYLADPHRDAAFWSELGELTEALLADLRAQRSHTVIEATAMAVPALVADIRAALHAAAREGAEPRSVKTRISPPALGVLVAITLSVLGCVGQTDADNSEHATGGAFVQAGAGALRGGLLSLRDV